MGDEFDAARYFGTWYEQTHSKFETFQNDSDVCVQAQYADAGTGDGTFTVNNSL